MEGEPVKHEKAIALSLDAYYESTARFEVSHSMGINGRHYPCIL
ncbi:MAG: hypothetical protein ACI92I_000318 [Acidimicrobiales bacterium]|jgi:hypothetical protein